MARQADGKVLIGGDFVFVDGLRRPSVARLNADGSVDPSFNAGDGVTSPFSGQITNLSVQTLAVQPDGRILVGGNFFEFNNAPASNLIRLNADGSHDASFAAMTFTSRPGYTAKVYALGVQSNGRIFAGGDFASIQGAAMRNFARLNADGTVDTSWTIDANLPVTAIAPAGGGDWLIGGGFTQLGGLPRAGLARLLANDSVSTTFVPPELLGSAGVRAVVPMDDGRILYGGYQSDGNRSAGFIRRLSSSGATDATFTAATISLGVYDLAILGDGSILFGGESFASENGQLLGSLVRLEADGTLHSSPTQIVQSRIANLLLLPNGTVLFGGPVIRVGQDLRLGMGLIRADGTLDPDYHPDATVAAPVRKITAIGGGRWAVAGGFAVVHSETGRAVQDRLARLDSNGQPDEAFVVAPTSSFVEYTAAAEASDGRLITGARSTFSTVQPLVNRFNDDGSIDSSFTTAFQAYEVINDLVVQPDDRILVGGEITPGVVRLLADGSRDASFFESGLGTANDLELLPGGKIVAAGSRYVVRLQPDGTFDDSFRTLNFNGPVYAVAPLSGQRLLVAGDFTTIDGQSKMRLVRLLANGEVDPTFVIGSGAEAAIRAIAVRSDGEIFLTGDFQSFDGVARARIVQLAPNGAVRSEFDPGQGLNATGYTLATETTGTILVGGAFTEVNGLTRFSMARVAATPLGTPLVAPPAADFRSATAVASNRALLLWGAVPAAEGFIVERSSDGSTGWLLLGSPEAGATSFTDLTAAPGQTYYYRVTPWNSGGDALPGSVRPVSLPAPDTLAGGILPGNTLDLWTRGDVRAVARQSDGKILVAGKFTHVHGVARANLARLNADGSLDTTFDPVVDVGEALNTLALQADGKIVVGGSNGASANDSGFIERYLADGTRDPTFPRSDQPNGAVNSVVVLPSGGLMIGGGFNAWGATSRSYLARLDADGGLDVAYDPARPTSTVTTLAIQSDGKMLVGGSFNSISNRDGTGTKVTRLARLNTDGTVDATFDAVNLINSSNGRATILALVLQADGKVLIGGNFVRLGPQPFSRILRLTSTGAVDETFDAGTGASSTVYAIGELSDGRIVIGGLFGGVAGFTRRNFAVLSSTGALEDAELSVAPPGVRALLPLPDGKFFVAGPFHGIGSDRVQSLARIVADGMTVDPTFAASLSQPGRVFAMAAQSDGKTVVVGDFTSVGGPDSLGVPRYDVLRLNPDDSLDSDFLGTFGFGRVALSVAVSADGKIWVGGEFPTPRNRLARLLPDGTLDSAFSAGSGPNNPVTALLPELDGGVTIGGPFTSVNSSSRSHLARFDATGVLAADFSGGGASARVSALAHQGDGKLLVAGGFGLIQGAGRRYLARLEADGAVDLSFAPDPSSSVESIILQEDGRLLVVGSFSFIGGASRNQLARLLPTGANDPDFSPALASPSTVTQVVRAADGGYFVLGTLPGLADYRTLRVGHFLADGTWDPAFDAGVFDDAAPVAGVASAGRLLLGGSFQSFHGQPHFGLVRLSTTSTLLPPGPPAQFTLTARSSGMLSFAWSDSSGETGYLIERSPQSTTDWQAVAVLPADQTTYQAAGLAPGSQWRYRVSAFNAAGTGAPSDVLAVTLPSSFAQWRAAQQIDPATPAGEDLDGDGYGIFAEYALGLSAWNPDAALQPVAIVDDHLQLTYYRAQVDVTYTVVASTDLRAWSAEGVDQGTPGQWVTASTPLGSEGRKFLRLLLTQP